MSEIVPVEWIVSGRRNAGDRAAVAMPMVQVTKMKLLGVNCKKYLV